MRLISFVIRLLESKLNSRRGGLKVYWWRPRLLKGRNFGDELTPFLIEKLWGIKCRWTLIPDCEMIGAGSVIELANTRNTKGHKVNIWGSGLIEDGPRVDNGDLKYHLVRGPLTSNRVSSSETIPLGDPGLLISRAVKPSKKKYAIGIVPHIKDLRHEAILSLGQDCHIISPLQSPEKVAKEISACHVVFSSSLHGLIFSDSFKTPNYRFTLNGIEGGSYKFQDYYLSVQRDMNILSIDDVVAAVGSPKKQRELIENYTPVRHLQKIQDTIEATFPYGDK